MKRKTKIALLVVLVLAISVPAYAAFRGQMEAWGFTQSGATTTLTGNLVVTGTSAATGTQTFSDDLTLENEEIITNATDAVFGVTFNDDAAELGDVQISSSVTAGEDANYFRQSWWFEDDGSVKSEFAFIDVSMDDETSDTTDGTIELGMVTNDTLAAKYNFDGAAFYPETDNNVDVGKSGAEFKDGYFDGTINADATSFDLVNGHDEVRVLSFSYYDPDVAASQSAAVWGLDPSASVGGSNFTEIVMPYAGSVIGVSVALSAAVTTGTITVDPTIDGSVTGLTAALTVAGRYGSSTQANDTDTFTADQRIGVKVTTTGDFGATSVDAVVTVYVEY